MSQGLTRTRLFFCYSPKIFESKTKKILSGVTIRRVCGCHRVEAEAEVCPLDREADNARIELHIFDFFWLA